MGHSSISLCSWSVSDGDHVLNLAEMLISGRSLQRQYIEFQAELWKTCMFKRFEQHAQSQ